MNSAAMQRPFNQWDALKLIALVLMFVDHTGHFFYPDVVWFRSIGRSCAPVFLFLTGFAAHYRVRTDLVLLAILVNVSDYLQSMELSALNILFNILLCRMIFIWLEKRGKIIERPFEWFVGCIAMVFSIVVVHYGSLGMLFAISGYMMRRPEHYSLRQRQLFLICTAVAYAVVQGTLFAATDPFNWVLMCTCLGATTWLLYNMGTRPVGTVQMPRPLMVAGKYVSAYSLYIYAVHVIALCWITGQHV